MSDTATDGDTQGLSGRSIIDAINRAKIEYVVSVPDITTSDGLLFPLARGVGPRLVRICKEDEGIGICAGLSYANKRGMLLIQNTGLLYAANSIRGIAAELRLPICMMVGLLEKEAGVMPTKSKKYGVRIVEPFLNALEIKYINIEHESDIAKIEPAIDEAYKNSQPIVFLIGQRPAA